VEVIGEKVGEVFQGVLRSPGEPGLARRPVRRMIQKVKKKSTGAREIITSNYISTSSLQTSKILPGPPRGSPESVFFHDYSWECLHELPICAGFLFFFWHREGSAIKCDCGINQYAQQTEYGDSCRPTCVCNETR
jgi:hypothetical protein